ncbi:hypothetical protein AVEN_82801-1 [Araneus ventricosus]|uniref:Uncharacterized protein n=1 Tax=Araneus ventricosus TaxID=182803 RepID=A0A4Y2D9Q0_ARAVE|nr:hypothetical protein AVEN_82801-1 [Araneus ventricosus]
MVDSAFIILFGKVSWLFSDNWIIFLFGPDETFKAKAVPYGMQVEELDKNVNKKIKREDDLEKLKEQLDERDIYLDFCYSE